MMGIGMRVRGKSYFAGRDFYPIAAGHTTRDRRPAHAATPECTCRARELYHRTAYRESLAVLLEAPVSTRGPGQPKEPKAPKGDQAGDAATRSS